MDAPINIAVELVLPRGPKQPGRLVVAVTGPRKFNQSELLYNALDGVEYFASKHGLILTLVEGGQLGTDSIAREWAKAQDIDVITEIAFWSFDGKTAGEKRNQRMIDNHQPDLCIAMSGGRGDMVQRCKAAGIPVFALNQGAE